MLWKLVTVLSFCKKGNSHRCLHRLEQSDSQGYCLGEDSYREEPVYRRKGAMP